MAEVIGTAIVTAVASSAAASATVVGTLTVGQLVGSIVVTGALVGASYATQSLSAQKQRREAQQATLNEAMGPRRFIYGQARVGGTRAFWDARNGEMYQCLLLCSHEIDSIQEYWVGDVKVETDGGTAGGNVITFPMINKIFFERYLGTADQPASLILTTRFPDVWSANHRLRGIAHVDVVFGGTRKEETQKVFPQGAYTQLRFVVRGKKIFDPSLGSMDPENPATWAWGDNSGDVILDYLRSPDGYRRPLSQIDMPSFEAFHAHCAENVPRADGSPVARYRTWGTVGFDEEPQAVLNRLCATCDATLYQGPTGQIGIRHGGWSGPLINIPTQHITGAALTQGNGRLNSYNRLKISYTEPDNYWGATELTARDDLASQAEIGVIEEVRDLVMVPEWTQAARLAKIMMAEDNPVWKGSIATDLMPLDALDASAVDITFQPVPGESPLMNAPCKIAGFTLRGDVSGCDISFRAVPASAREWNAAAEQPPKPVTPSTITHVDVVPDPAGVSASVERPSISGDVQGVAIRLSWAAPSRPDVQPEAQFAPTGSSGWAPMANAADELSALSPLLTDGGAYDWRVRFVAGYGGAVSNWVTGGPVSAVSDPDPPAAPLGFIANGSSGQASLSWTAPNSPNYGSAKIYRATAGAGFGSATLIATIYGGPNLASSLVDSGLSAGDYDYWVRACNRTGFGDATSTAGPSTATVS